MEYSKRRKRKENFKAITKEKKKKIINKYIYKCAYLPSSQGKEKEKEKEEKKGFFLVLLTILQTLSIPLCLRLCNNNIHTTGAAGVVVVVVVVTCLYSALLCSAL